MPPVTAISVSGAAAQQFLRARWLLAASWLQLGASRLRGAVSCLVLCNSKKNIDLISFYTSYNTTYNSRFQPPAGVELLTNGQSCCRLPALAEQGSWGGSWHQRPTECSVKRRQRANATWLLILQTTAEFQAA